ncbi:MAG: hypothetical protein K0S55_823 [Clostridia bacterium]|nr:hypothetical protein [Clostridia bacterium]
MSYCVNCGVELGKSEKECPLCNCPVINPMQNNGNTENVERVWPQIEDKFDFWVERRFYSIVFSIVLSVPAFICMLVDIAYTDTLSWSLYVVSAIMLAWVFIVLPILWRSALISTLLVADIAAILLFLSGIEDLMENTNWFLRLALPITMLIGIFAYIITRLIEENIIKRLYIYAFIFLSTGVLMAFIEVICDLYLAGSIKIIWSLYAIIPCFALSALLFFIERNKKLKSNAEKRLHL